jgi:hypothetical protein
MAWHHRNRGKQRRCGGEGLPEEGSGGGVDKMHGEGPFYSSVSHRSNADLGKERGREVTAELGVEAKQACTRVAQSAAWAAMGIEGGHGHTAQAPCVEPGPQWTR